MPAPPLLYAIDVVTKTELVGGVVANREDSACVGKEEAVLIASRDLQYAGPRQ